MMISTPRLTLRPLKKGTPRQVAWLNDPDVVKFSEQRHRRHTLSSQLDYVSHFPGFIWGIHRVESGEHVGNVTAAIDPPNRIADVGILIGDKDSRGLGLGMEAWGAACNWLMSPDGAGLRKLEAGCMKCNEPMLRIVRKTGFVQEGERLNHFLLNGSPITAVLFGRSR
jgi:RimJ/RimL family protein N-acetyltransferase